MKDREYIIILYDYYGDLLTETQKAYFEEYYFDNLSLGEISENENKSRNAIHKNLKTVVNKLYDYEKKLKLYNKHQKLEKILLEIKDEKIKNKIEELLWKINYQYI